MKTRFVLVATIVAIVALCVYVDHAVLVEYYGEGSPYYGRSVNMDKWQNPLPLLTLFNVVMLVMIGLLLKILKRK